MPDKTFHIPGIPGSLRRASYNRGLLCAAHEVTPEGVGIEIVDRFDADGNLTDEVMREWVRKLVVALVDWTRRLRESGLSPSRG